MKQFRRILLFIGLLGMVSIAGYLIVFGYIKKSFTSNIQQKAEVPIEALFDYLSDPNYYPAWYSGFIREQRIRGDGFSTGSVSLLHTTDEDEKFSLVQKIYESQPPNHLRKEIIHDFYNLTIDLELEEINNQSTTATITFELSGHNFLQRILSPLFATQVLSEHRDMYIKALRLAEDKFPGE